MTLPWILGLAAVTYASRALALVLMPQPSPRVRAILERMPAPLFAGLAALSVVDVQGVVAEPHVFGAIAGALIATPLRSLLLVLLAGLGGYGITVALT